jgi:hypothetical protein
MRLALDNDEGPVRVRGGSGLMFCQPMVKHCALLLLNAHRHRVFH